MTSNPQNISYLNYQLSIVPLILKVNDLISSKQREVLVDLIENADFHTFFDLIENVQNVSLEFNPYPENFTRNSSCDLYINRTSYKSIW